MEFHAMLIVINVWTTSHAPTVAGTIMLIVWEHALLVVVIVIDASRMAWE